MLDLLIAFGIAFGFIFVNEIGDKTQIIILCLATKKEYSPKKLAMGAVSGFAVVVALGGVIALVLSAFIQLDWISIGSGSMFIVLGIVQIVKWTREQQGKHEKDLACDEEEAKRFEKTKNSFLSGFLQSSRWNSVTRPR